MATPDERIEKLKRILVGILNMVHDTIVDISAENKTFYKEVYKKFTKYENLIERV